MKKKEWQNLHHELTTLNNEFNINLNIKREVKNRKQKKEAEERLSYIMELAFARITSNEKSYKLLIGDLPQDELFIKTKLAQLSDEAAFNFVIAEYLGRLKERIQ